MTASSTAPPAAPAAPLDHLPSTGTRLLAHQGGAFDDNEDLYTSRAKNHRGVQNHFQGCKRLEGGPYLAVTGGSLIGMHNPSEATPAINQPDVADVFRVQIPNEATPIQGPNPVIDSPLISAVQPLGLRYFREPRGSYNFDAGAGLFDNAPAPLRLYSVSHFRIKSEGCLRFVEFA